MGGAAVSEPSTVTSCTPSSGYIVALLLHAAGFQPESHLQRAGTPSV